VDSETASPEPATGDAVDDAATLGESDAAADDPVAGHPVDADPLADSPAGESAVDAEPSEEVDFAGDTAGEPTASATGGDALDGAASAEDGRPADDAPTEADAFDGSPFESAGVEGEDLATEVAELRHTVEQQSERLDRQSALIEQLIEELRRGR
jgi:hypothetical protein